MTTDNAAGTWFELMEVNYRHTGDRCNEVERNVGDYYREEQRGTDGEKTYEDGKDASSAGPEPNASQDWRQQTGRLGSGLEIERPEFVVVASNFHRLSKVAFEHPGHFRSKPGIGDRERNFKV